MPTHPLFACYTRFFDNLHALFISHGVYTRTVSSHAITRNRRIYVTLSLMCNYSVVRSILILGSLGFYRTIVTLTGSNKQNQKQTNALQVSLWVVFKIWFKIWFSNSFPKMSSGRKRSLSGPATTSVQPNAKKKRYLCTYQKSWESQFKWIKESDRGPNDAFCTLCNSNIYIGSSAKSDIVRHAKTQNHMKIESCQNQSKSISSFVPGVNKSLKEKIIKAETIYSNFGTLFHVSHNEKIRHALSPAFLHVMSCHDMILDCWRLATMHLSLTELHILHLG